MLKKQYRLKKKYQFNYVYRVGKSVGGKYLVIYSAPSKNKNIHVGIVVSKKLGHAVVRNRTKRRIREAISPALPVLAKNYNVVIIARQSILDATYWQIAADLENTLKKANLLQKS
jgi:ribonuclease P protein component